MGYFSLIADLIGIITGFYFAYIGIKSKFSKDDNKSDENNKPTDKDE